MNIRSILQWLVAFIVLVLVSPVYAQLLSSELKMQQDSFISPHFQSSSKSNYQLLGLRLVNREPGRDLFNIDLRGLFAFDAPFMNSLNVPEFYHQIHQVSDDTYLILGRKRWHWSELDERWTLGIFEPNYEWNPLNPEGQGLTGLFWQVNHEHLNFTIFASPVYLPSQGPSFQINEQGEFERGSPWFRRPPESIRVFKEVSKLEYEFQKPNESSVISQSSFATRLAYGDVEGFRAQLSYAYKPVNKLALAYDGILDISKDRGVVNIMPVVTFHSLVGLDFEYKRKNWKSGISFLNNRPQKEISVDEKWTTPVFSEANLMTAYVDVEFTYLGLSLQRLQSSGGDVKEKGPLSSPDRPSISTIYPYREANQLSLRTQFRFERERTIKSQISYIRSDYHFFDILKWNANLKITRSWNIFGEIQLVKAEPANKYNYSDIVALANNDRWMMGAGYVF